VGHSVHGSAKLCSKPNFDYRNFPSSFLALTALATILMLYPWLPLLIRFPLVLMTGNYWSWWNSSPANAYAINS